MSGFAPSASAANGALPNNSIRTRAHPRGMAGAKLSLDEVAARVKEGRNDPRVRAWASKALIDAGRPQDVRGQAQAILDKLRSQTMYVMDPVNTELIAKPHVTMCLDEHGLCLPGADCDDLTVAFGSATMSVGIETEVVGQAFGMSVPTHVIAAVRDGGTWLKVDPSEKDYPVGKAHAATKEWRIDPLANAGTGLDGTGGDFVGVGGIGPVLTQDQFDVVTAQVRAAVNALAAARDRLGASLQTVQKTRILTNPTAPFDPDTTIIRSVNDFPSDGSWTQLTDSISTQVWDIADRMVTMGNEALNGTREILVSPDSLEVYIQSKLGDTWLTPPLIQTAENLVLGFFGPTGLLLSAFNTKTATPLTPAQVQSGTLGSAQVVVALVVGAVVAVAACWAFVEYCTTAATAAEQATQKAALDCVAAGNCPASVIKEVTDAAKAGKEKPNTLTDVASIVTWVVVGGVVIAGLVAVTPLLRTAAEAVRRKS